MAKWNWNPSGPTVLPAEQIELKDGMVVLLKKEFGDNLLQRLFRTSGGGFGASIGGSGKIYGTFLETNEHGHIYRNQMEGIYKGHIPTYGAVYHRAPRGYWVKKMPEIIKFLRGYDKKKNLTIATVAKMKEYTRELFDGLKEMDVVRQREDETWNEKEQIRFRREGGNTYKMRNTPSYNFILNVWTAQLMAGHNRKYPKALEEASEALMNLAKLMDSFNETAPHTNSPRRK